MGFETDAKVESMNMSERATMSTDDGAAQADNAAESWDRVQVMSKASVTALPHLSGNK